MCEICLSNLISFHRNFSSICPTAVPEVTPETSGANTASEASSALSGEHQSDFLIGLFHEVSSLKSDVLRQKALRIIKDLALAERHDSEDQSQTKDQVS